MTARTEILEAVDLIISERESKQFRISEVLDMMKDCGTAYKESTIRTHIVSKCCGNVPNHHGTVYNDFERIGKGLYIRKGGQG